MKAYIASMMHETNTFSPIPTNLQSFRDALYYDPETDADSVDITKILGFEGVGAELDRLGYEPIIGPVAVAVPGGALVRRDYETIRDHILAHLRKNGDVDIVLTNQRNQVISPDVFTQVGIDPAAKGIVVVKSSQHFRAGFDPIATETIYCDTPGTLNIDFATMPFERIPRPVWPLDDIPEDGF